MTGVFVINKKYSFHSKNHYYMLASTKAIGLTKYVAHACSNANIIQMLTKSSNQCTCKNTTF